VVEIALTPGEQDAFDKSVDAVRGLLDACRNIDTSLA
jgi:malate dehydrogenase